MLNRSLADLVVSKEARQAMKWDVNEAEANFDEFLEAVITQGPQILTRDGEEIAVCVSYAEWQRIEENSKGK